MKKILAACLLVLPALYLAALSTNPVIPSHAAASSLSPRLGSALHVPAPKPGNCGGASVHFLSYPAKCLTQSGYLPMTPNIEP
jgi:hypothetical protein